MITFFKQHKKKAIVVAGLVVVSLVALIYPEHTETVAKALVALIGLL